jgi:hypothetical protein
MWRTVEAYAPRGRVPQFHGKWPFLRLLGLQEPASVLASLLNLATNTAMVVWFTSRVPSQAAMYWVGEHLIRLISHDEANLDLYASSSYLDITFWCFNC